METSLSKLDQLLASKVEVPQDQLADYLASVLSGLDHAKTGTQRSGSGIFWALTRVFGCYDRLIEACEQYVSTRADDIPFIAELEIEHFLMRLRVLLDEVAYAIRIRLPNDIRGLGPPKGPGPIEYKQFRITELLKFVEKYPSFSMHLTDLLQNNRTELRRYVELRDDIAHFRAKAFVFRGGTMSVGFFGSRENDEKDASLPHTDLLTYVNGATVWMWTFLQKDVVRYFRRQIKNGEIGFVSFGIGPHRISMPGIIRFKRVLETIERKQDVTNAYDEKSS